MTSIHDNALGTLPFEPFATAPSTTSNAIPRISARAGLQRYRNDRAGILAELGDQRIDIVESALGPVRLVFVTEAELARSVLVEHNDSFRKGPAVSRHLVSVLGNGLLTSTGADHRRQRKVLAPQFKPRQIAGFAQTMIDIIEAMLADWRRCRPVDFDAEATTLTMSIATRTLFGVDITAEDIDTLSAGLTIANRWVINRSISIANLPAWLPSPANLAMRKAVQAMDKVVYRLIAEHRAGGPKHDVLAALMAARDENGDGMSDELLRDQALTFLLAGHETIATTLSWAYRLLSEHPEVVERIATEARDVFGPATTADSDGAGRAPDVRRLVYSRAVLQEVMRLRPAAYMIGRQARNDVAIGNYRIRAGSYVVINTLGMHRRDDYFADPLAFRCERFLSEPTWPRTAYLPFGAGPRVCIGNHFGMMEGTLVLALMCRALRFNDRSERDHGGPAGTSDAPRGLDADPMITLRPSTNTPFDMTWRDA